MKCGYQGPVAFDGWGLERAKPFPVIRKLF